MTPVPNTIERSDAVLITGDSFAVDDAGARAQASQGLDPPLASAGWLPGRLLFSALFAAVRAQRPMNHPITNTANQNAMIRVDARKWAAARLAPKKYGDRVEHDVRGSTTLNYQPAILIKVGDRQATRFEDAAAPKAARGVLLDGSGEIARER